MNQEEQIYLLQRLAHLHTGRIEDIVTIVDSNIRDLPSDGDARTGASGKSPPQTGDRLGMTEDQARASKLLAPFGE